MWATLILTVIVGTPAIYLSAIAYVRLLLHISRASNGWRKNVLAMLLYLIYIPVFVSPMFLLMMQERDAMRESTTFFILSMLGYFLIVSPGIYYIRKIRGDELKEAGYS